MFFIERDGKRLATLTGAGGRLVEAAVHWARNEKKMVLPLCPFARSVFEKTPAYQDVLLR